MSNASGLAIPGFDPVVPALAAPAGKPAGAGRGAGAAAAFLDFMQELGAAGDSGMPANPVPAGNAEPATDDPSAANPPSRGSRGAAAMPRARTARQTGGGEKDGATSLGLAPLPAPAADSRRDGLAIGASTAPPDSNETDGTTGFVSAPIPASGEASRRDGLAIGANVAPPSRAETPVAQGYAGLADGWRIGMATASLAGTVPAGDAGRSRNMAATGQQPESEPAAPEAAAGTGASNGKSRGERSETPTSLVEAGGQSNLAPPATATNGIQTGGDGSVAPDNAAATPADAGGPASSNTLSAPATDVVGAAEAGEKQAPPPTAGDDGQAQPVAELAFAARLSPAGDRVHRAGGAESANLDSAGGQAPDGATAPPGSPSGVPSREAAGAQAAPAPTTAAPGTPSAASIRNAAATSESAGPVAHDIKLELAGAGPRVEVRLVERAGEVHVAVRTPDGRLAEAMRDDLPALAARLEQTGFHGNEWRTGTAGGGQRALEIDRTGAGAREFQEDPGGRGRQQPGEDKGQERQHAQAQTAGSRSKGFASLISSLRGTREES